MHQYIKSNSLYVQTYLAINLILILILIVGAASTFWQVENCWLLLVLSLFKGILKGKRY